MTKKTKAKQNKKSLNNWNKNDLKELFQIVFLSYVYRLDKKH